MARSTDDTRSTDDARPTDEPVPPSAPTITYGLPGGAASVIAHLVGVPLVALTGWTIAGLDMWVMILVIAVVALGLLFTFEYRSPAAATAHLPAPHHRRASRGRDRRASPRSIIDTLELDPPVACVLAVNPVR